MLIGILAKFENEDLPTTLKGRRVRTASRASGPRQTFGSQRLRSHGRGKPPTLRSQCFGFEGLRV